MSREPVANYKISGSGRLAKIGRWWLIAGICLGLGAWSGLSGGAEPGPGEIGPWSAQSADTIRIAVVADKTMAQPGDTLHIDLNLTAAGPAFNAYDAYVSYDSSRLTFLGLANPRDQQGPLMTGACAQTFHIFNVAPDSSHLVINHSLLCPGVTVTGPGVLYRLQFVCKPLDADTSIHLTLDPPRQSRFFRDGAVAGPLVCQPVFIRIGEGASDVPDLGPGRLRLRNAPNPFNPITRFSFQLAEPRAYRLDIHTLDGRRVRTMSGQGAGEVVQIWDGRDDAGRPLPSGCYLARITAGRQSGSGRAVLVR